MYGGKEYVVNSKYAQIINLTYVTMMYGVGLPLLFPILTIAMIIFYLHQRYHVAYSHRLPPTLDDRLVKNATRVLKFAPLLLMFNGYWMLSNKQIFHSLVSTRDTEDDHM